MVVFHSYVSLSEGIHLGKLSSTRYSLKPPARYSPLVIMMMITSSTAQGGGGSFKNRKPIGEVGCCESGMAKRIH